MGLRKEGGNGKGLCYCIYNPSITGERQCVEGTIWLLSPQFRVIVRNTEGATVTVQAFQDNDSVL